MVLRSSPGLVVTMAPGGSSGHPDGTALVIALSLDTNMALGSSPDHWNQHCPQWQQEPRTSTQTLAPGGLLDPIFINEETDLKMMSWDLRFHCA